MMVAALAHPVVIDKPFYASGRGVELHRYLDAEFIPRFQQELRRNTLGTAAATGWQWEDRFSKHDDALVLRLPIHRTFYVASCEVACERLGQPALDPARITSAGFVIRRVGGPAELAWMLEDGEPVGWEPVASGARDPDIHRRLCTNGVLHRRTTDPAYSGEEVHPLHVSDARDATGKRHTVLYGYLPLGGFHYLRTPSDQSPFDAASEALARSAVAGILPWPYGYRDVGGRRGRRRRVWRDSYTRAVENGRPSKPFFELLEMLVNRQHLGERDVAENAALEALARKINFYDDESWAERGPEIYADNTRYAFNYFKRFSLWSYLESAFAEGENNPLTAWLARQQREIDKSGGLDAHGEIDPLPARAPAAEGALLSHSLYLTSGDAQEFRELTGQRMVAEAASRAREVPVPKFAQGAEDLYRVVPFLRATDDAGKERIYWIGNQQRSEPFRVAAPFEAMASRPSLIQIPSLADLRRGFAKGAAMVTPPDTYNLIEALNLKKGASEDAVPDEAPSGGFGIQWICSFSLPAITLVAMILLMIMISLLNIVFQWMAWVRICLPFPKAK